MWKRNAIFRIQISNEGKSKSHEIAKTSFVVGRDNSCAIQITAASVSRSHLRVELKNGNIWIKDLSSSSGTKLNGMKLEPKQFAAYNPGDVIDLGVSNVTLILTLLKNEPETPSPLKARMQKIIANVKEAAIRLRSKEIKEEVLDKTIVDPAFHKISPQVDPALHGQIVSEAKATAIRIKIAAEAEAVKILQDAKQKALSEITSAHEKADELIIKARDQAFRIQSEGEAETAKMRHSMQKTITIAHEEIEQKNKLVRRETREKCDKILHEAHEKGTKTLTEYQSKAEKLLSDARLAATGTKAEAQKEADVILGQAHKKTTDLKTSLEAEAQNFRQLEKKKSEEFLLLTQTEADRILEEAKQTSSLIRVKTEEEINKIQKNASLEAKTIKDEAQKEAERTLLQALEQAKSVSNKMTMLTQSQAEDQKADLLRAATEAATKIKEDGIREAKKEALLFLKTAEADRSELTKAVEKLNQDLLVQEKKKLDISESIKKLQKKDSDIKDEIEAFAVKLANVEIETNKKMEEVRAKTRAAEAVLESKVREVEKRKEEGQKIFDAAREAEALTKKTAEERFKLSKAIEELKKNQTLLIDESNVEIKRLRDKVQADYDQKKTEQDAQLAKMRMTELETIKGLRAEEEGRFKARRKHQILEIAKALETYLVPRIKEEFDLKDIPKGLTNMYPELKKIVDTVIEDEFSGLRYNSSAKNRKNIVSIGLGTGFAIFVGLFFIFNNRDQISRKPASEIYIDRLREKEAQKPKFTPNITDDYKNTYTDNVIYTKDYINFKLNPSNQSKWIEELNKFFVNNLGLNENAIVKFISIESNLVNQLKELRAVIHYENQKEEIQKMSDLEKDTVKDMVEVLGTQEKYKSFRDFEKDYFSKARQPASSENH